GIPFNDPTVGIEWPDCGSEYLLSDKDKKHEPFAVQSFDYFERW
ncbi:dTDP-4-dehydrorhamnose 3,5-epimerase, partial [gut metagenome]